MKILDKTINQYNKKYKINFGRDSEDILIYAFRYALGRMTYAVSQVIDVILENKDLLSNRTKLRMIIEIEEHKYNHGIIGMEMDDKRWMYLKETLQGLTP